MTPEAATYRLLHWNVHSWVDPDSSEPNASILGNLLGQHSPDLVSLVEVDESWEERSQLSQVAGSAGYTSVFAPTFEYGADHPKGGFGNAVLSRMPVHAVRQRQLTWPTTVYDGSEPSEPRSVLLVTLATPTGQRITMGATHLPRQNVAGRSHALDRLMAMLAQLPTPWIVCGDFNTAAHSWPAPARRDWIVAPPASPTYPSDDPAETIDYAVASSGSVQSTVVPARGSDHLPVVVQWNCENEQ